MIVCVFSRDIDTAFLRRFERKLLLALPDSSIRMAMIRGLVPVAVDWPADVLLQMAELSEGFSGDELRIAAKEAAMSQIRRAISLTNNHRKAQSINVFIVTIIVSVRSLNRSDCSSGADVSKTFANRSRPHQAKLHQTVAQAHIVEQPTQYKLNIMYAMQFKTEYILCNNKQIQL